MTIPNRVPNHHADHAGFAGASGTLAALSMLVGRRPTARLATELVALGPRDRLVDVGCGPGAGARFAAARGASVVGVDPAEVMLRTARRVPGGREVDWRVGTAEALPLEDSTATVLWGLATVHHWTDLDRAIAEAARVLEPGGRLLAVERRVQAGATGHASHGWTDDQADAFADAVRSAGFAAVEVGSTRAGRTTHIHVLARSA